MFLLRIHSSHNTHVLLSLACYWTRASVPEFNIKYPRGLNFPSSWLASLRILLFLALYRWGNVRASAREGIGRGREETHMFFCSFQLFLSSVLLYVLPLFLSFPRLIEGGKICICSFQLFLSSVLLYVLPFIFPFRGWVARREKPIPPAMRV